MKKGLAWRYAFAVFLLIVGILLNYFQVGMNGRLGFGSIGNWLIYVTFVMLAVITLQSFNKKKRLVDERMNFVAWKAARATFVVIIFAAFVLMVIDAINPLNIPIYMLMNYLICLILIAYFVSYKILLKYN